MRPAILPLLLVLAVLTRPLPAQSWPIDLALHEDACQVIALGQQDLRSVDALQLSWPTAPEAGSGWIECCLLTNDQRFFATAMPLLLERHDEGLHVPLYAGAWCGEDGSLSADALRGVRQLWIRVHGVGSAAGSRVRGRLTIRRGAAQAQQRGLQLLAEGLVDRGPWRELHFRLLGPFPVDPRCTVLTSQGAALPCFLDQPCDVVAGRWYPRGPTRFTLRLRHDEPLAAGWRVRVGPADAPLWTSPDLPAYDRVVAQVALPQDPAGLLPLPTSPGWRGHYVRIGPDGARQRLRGCCDGPALAPILFWRESWTGFRGPAAIGHPYAVAFDRALASGVAAIDLLPQRLFEEQGAFRFGLTPLHTSAGGPWAAPQEAFAEPRALQQLEHHARTIIARARAAPELAAWRVSCVQSANNPDQRERLDRFVRTLWSLVHRFDGRELHIRHPQAVDYAKVEPEPGPWFSFEPGEPVLDEHRWMLGVAPPPPPPLTYRNVRAHSEPIRLATGKEARERRAPTSEAHASHGNRSLALPLTRQADSKLVSEPVAVVRALDANTFGLDRLELDVLLRGSGMAELHCWVTDHHHRWYQQRIEAIRANAPWQTLGVDFSPHADWRAVGHDHPWTGLEKRRIRLLGFVAYPHHDPGERMRASVLHLDRLRRFGWPREHIAQLEVRDLDPLPAQSACYASLDASFDLSLRSRNPYDPEHADVVGELRTPDGRVIRHPAFWSEPYRLDLRDGVEHAVPAGPGRWHWRITPTMPGTWAWRLVARIKPRASWRACSTPWRELTVTAPADDALLPVIRSDDPAWWQTTDGDWFYPIGLNMRSPGDARQDLVLNNAGAKRRSADWERRGTRAYADWFARMQANGIDFARVWMCPWWCGLEWGSGWDEFGGLTDYNQAAAARLDRVMQLAAEHGIYIQLELQNHGMTSTDVDEQWTPTPEDPGSPYNVVNGGPCDSAIDFFRDSEAWDIHAKRLRYTVARWGHCSHLMAWVLSSEMEFTAAFFYEAYRPGYNDPTATSPTLTAWIERSLRWFREYDFLQRPVSIHFSHPWRAKKIWQIDGLGFSYSNAYTGFQREMGKLGGTSAGLGSAMHYYLNSHFPPWRHQRPTMIGEWGGHWEERDSATLAAELHTGLWMQANLPLGGNVGFWWWLWVDATDSWGEYAAIRNYIAGEDPRGQDMRPQRPRIRGGERSAWLYGMRGRDRHRYYAWLGGLDRDLDLDNDEDCGTAEIVTGEPGSTWRIERWRCRDGKRIATTTASADDGGLLHLPLGVLDPDAAFKLDRIEPKRGPAPKPQAGEAEPTSAAQADGPARTQEPDTTGP